MSYICASCGDECDAKIIDDSFDYSYGSINDTEVIIGTGSSCCDAELLKPCPEECERGMVVCCSDANCTCGGKPVPCETCGGTGTVKADVSPEDIRADREADRAEYLLDQMEDDKYRDD